MFVRSIFVFACKLLVVNQSFGQVLAETYNTTLETPSLAFKDNNATTQRPGAAPHTNESIATVIEPDGDRISVTGKMFVLPDKIFVVPKKPFVKSEHELFVAEKAHVPPENKGLVTESAFVPSQSNISVTEKTFVQPENRILVTQKLFVAPEDNRFVHAEKFKSPNPLYGNFTLRLKSWADYLCGQDGLCDREKAEWECAGGAVCYPCRCDKDCLQYGDCCLDAYPSDDIQITTQNMSCVTASVKRMEAIPAKRYFMVSSCPDTDSRDNSDVVSHCNMGTYVDPVYSAQTGMHYVNKNCAICNNVSNYVIWRPQPTCLGLVNYTHIISPKSFLQHSLVNPSCDLHFVPPENSAFRECSHDGYNMVSSCPSGAQPDEDRIYCERYFSPVTLGLTTYRNIFCAACQGVPLQRDYDFCPIIPALMITLAAVSRLTMVTETQADYSFNTASGQEVCLPTEVFDPYQGSCRPMFCPAGKVVWQHDCLDILPSAYGLGYSLSYKLVPVEPAIFQDVAPSTILSAFDDFWEHIEDMTRIAVGKTKLVLEHVSRPRYFDTSNSQGRFEVLSITVTAYVVSTEHTPREQMERILKDVVLGGWHFNNEGRLVTFEPTWIPEHDDFLKQDHSILIKYSNGNTSSITKLSIRSYSGPILSDYIDEPSAYITINEMMQCKMIQLNSSEYEGDTETGIRYLGKTLRYGQFVPADGDNIRVCSDFSGKRTSSSDAFTSNDKRDGNALSPAVTSPTTLWTVASFAASLILLFPALLLLILDQSVCGPSRLCNIVFTLNLFCGGVLFLVGSAIKLGSVTCSVLGVVIHYSWLSASFWGLLAAVRLNQTPTNFPAGTKKRICQPSFWGIGQGTSALVVVVTIAAHLLSTTGPSHLATGYGQTLITHSRACFLTSQLGRILGFLVPAGLALLLTVILSAKTAFVNRGGITGDPAKWQLAIISMKTSLILLLTWAVGVSALGTDDDNLWIFFVLLNVGVGLFVCVGIVESKIGSRTKEHDYIPRENSVNVYDPGDKKPELTQVATKPDNENVF